MKFKLATAAAAVLMSATASQAADLAKKAPVAVDYVKVCDAYGAGFFYIPGTDTCLRIGGYIRAQVVGGDDSYGATDVAYYGNYSEANASNSYESYGRFLISADARSQTEFGVLRGFGAIYGTASNSSKTSFEVDKAYIQFAGFTAGYAGSFYDFFTGYTKQFKYGGVGELDESRDLLAYTFGFGNGLSATISLEDGQLNGRLSESSLYGGNKSPDFVGQLKLTQAWGAAQLSAVAHHNQGGAAVDVDKYGYAILAGVQVNLPMLGAGDALSVQAAWGKGALAYVSSSIGKSPVVVNDFYANGDQSEAWAIKGGFKHVFSPAWTFAIDGGYSDLDQPAANEDLTQWDVATMISWTPVTNLEIAAGLEYRSTDASGATPDEDGWAFGLRVQRSF